LGFKANCETNITRNANPPRITPTFTPKWNGQYTQTAYTIAAHMALPMKPAMYLTPCHLRMAVYPPALLMESIHAIWGTVKASSVRLLVPSLDWYRLLR